VTEQGSNHTQKIVSNEAQFAKQKKLAEAKAIAKSSNASQAAQQPNNQSQGQQNQTLSSKKSAEEPNPIASHNTSLTYSQRKQKEEKGLKTVKKPQSLVQSGLIQRVQAELDEIESENKNLRKIETEVRDQQETLIHKLIDLSKLQAQ